MRLKALAEIYTIIRLCTAWNTALRSQCISTFCLKIASFCQNLLDFAHTLPEFLFGSQFAEFCHIQCYTLNLFNFREISRLYQELPQLLRVPGGRPVRALRQLASNCDGLSAAQPRDPRVGPG